MTDVLRRLRPDGVFSVFRVSDREVHRLTSMALAGLRALGVAHPERHVVAIAHGFFRTLLVKRSPFTGEELDRIRAWVERPPADILIPLYGWLGFSFREPMQLLYLPAPRRLTATPYFEALADQRVDAYVAPLTSTSRARSTTVRSSSSSLGPPIWSFTRRATC